MKHLKLLLAMIVSMIAISNSYSQNIDVDVNEATVMDGFDVLDTDEGYGDVVYTGYIKNVGPYVYSRTHGEIPGIGESYMPNTGSSVEYVRYLNSHLIGFSSFINASESGYNEESVEIYDVSTGKIVFQIYLSSCDVNEVFIHKNRVYIVLGGSINSNSWYKKTTTSEKVSLDISNFGGKFFVFDMDENIINTKQNQQIYKKKSFSKLGDSFIYIDTDGNNYTYRINKVNFSNLETTHSVEFTSEFAVTRIDRMPTHVMQEANGQTSVNVYVGRLFKFDENLINITDEVEYEGNTNVLINKFTEATQNIFTKSMTSDNQYHYVLQDNRIGGSVFLAFPKYSHHSQFQVGAPSFGRGINRQTASMQDLDGLHIDEMSVDNGVVTLYGYYNSQEMSYIDGHSLPMTGGTASSGLVTLTMDMNAPRSQDFTIDFVSSQDDNIDVEVDGQFVGLVNVNEDLVSELTLAPQLRGATRIFPRGSITHDFSQGPVFRTLHQNVNDDSFKFYTAQIGVIETEVGEPLDTDDDGVPDDEDECPDTAGDQPNGCPIPDSDEDGIPDEDDICPDSPGSENNHGCHYDDVVIEITTNSATCDEKGNMIMSFTGLYTETVSIVVDKDEEMIRTIETSPKETIVVGDLSPGNYSATIQTEDEEVDKTIQFTIQ